MQAEAQGHTVVDDSGNKWIAYEPFLHGDDYIPVEKWGKDHWSTLLYAETRAVDHKGVLDNRHLRTDERLHREFAHQSRLTGGLRSGSMYPTRLADGETVEGRHDDWSCIEDAAAAGLILAYWRRINDEPFGCNIAKVVFSAKGRAFIADLRAWLAETGTNVADYQPDYHKIENIEAALRGDVSSASPALAWFLGFFAAVLSTSMVFPGFGEFAGTGAIVFALVLNVLLFGLAIWQPS